MRLLDGKVAIVTGGGQGIGRGIVRCFVKSGAKVVIAELNETRGKAAADEANELSSESAVFVRADVSDRAQVMRSVEACVSSFGGLDILVNNASGLSPNVLLEEKTDEMLEHVLRVGMWGTWWFMHGALPHLKARGGGSIINFYSIDAEVAAWLHADYNMNKSAIQGLSRSAAMEWARYGIRTNVVAPAAAGTVFEQKARDLPGFAETAARTNPMGHVGDPETDIAPVVLFLASDMARYVNGETIHVDGGLHLPRFDSRPSEFR